MMCRTDDRRPLLAVLVIAAALRLTLVFWTPPLFFPDEAGHLAYIHAVAVHQVLPVQTLDGRWANANGTEDFYHPPLYYLVAAPIYRLVWPSHSALYAVRLLSVAFSLALVAMVYGFVRRHFPELRWAPALSALFVAALPTLAGIGAAATNDALALLLITSVLVLLCSRRGDEPAHVRTLIAAGGLFGACLYTKNTALVLVAPLALWGPLTSRAPSWRWLEGLVPIALGVTLVAPWWVLRNQASYGSLLALDLHWGERGGPLYGRVLSTLAYAATTFWASLGRTTEVGIPAWVGPLLLLPAYASARHLGRAWRRLQPEQRRVLILCLAPLPLAAAQVLYYGVKWGFGQGRYLYPAILGIALVVGVGMTYSASRRQRQARMLLLACAVPAWVAYALLSVGPGYARVRVETAVGGLTDIRSFRTGDLDTWVMHRTAPLRAEDACRSYTHSPFSPAC